MFSYRSKSGDIAIDSALSVSLVFLLLVEESASNHKLPY